MADQKLENLAYRLKDLNSLRNLFSELNFDFEDKPVDKDNWSEEQKKMVKEARIIASKNEYYVYYIQTDTDSMKEWKGIASKIIKDNHGLCMICSHNPSGFKWVFSSLSKEFSKSFSETRHVPIDVKPDTGVPKTFVDFLEKIRINKDSTALSIVSKMSDAFDSFAIQIHDELTVNVFEALKTLSEGIILDKSNNLKLDERTLEEIRESTFILLYRIMFILYAEDRAVFPDEKFYQDNFSLKWIRSQWILKSNEDIAEYTVHERLKKLFRLIEIGSEGLDYDPKEFFMRSYYGRLFDRKIHYKLEEWKIPNKNLLSAIDYLTRTQDKKGNYFFLDYAALETRHLGAIYEHLLEYHLTVKDGKVSDLPNPKERKTTGSYYTPKYIVDYIVENTVGPLIDDIIKNTSDPGEQVDKILALNILDPAMGSGHFLVGATNYIAGRICEIEYKDDITEQVFVECKRDVARRCIYGVDINPLAVDLASVSLWLETLSSEKPLSFLSAHLKSGNSLMGSSIEDIFEKQTTLTESTKGRIRFKKTVRDFIMLEMLEDDTSDAVKTKTTKYNTMQSKGTVYSDLKFMLNAKLTKSFGIDVPVIGDFITKIGENSLDFYSDERWQNVKECASEHSFFHWDLEFPDIFYGEDGKRQKNPGFDGVVGNPPWETLKQDRDEFFSPLWDLHKDTTTKFSKLTKNKKQEFMNKCLDNTNIKKSYHKYQQNYISQTNFFSNSPNYKYQIAIVDGKKQPRDSNLYKLFLEKSYTVLSKNGLCGSVIPSGIYSDMGARGLREMLFENTEIKSLYSFINRKKIFEDVDSRFKFCLLVFEKGKNTKQFNASFYLEDITELQKLNDKAFKFPLEFIKKNIPTALSVIECSNKVEFDIMKKLFVHPLLAGNQWNLDMKVELNMTIHNKLFHTSDIGIPLYEGKMINLFRKDFVKPRYWIDQKIGNKFLKQKELNKIKKHNQIHNIKPLIDSDEYRLVWRTITNSTNERTLISTILPPRLYLGHSLNYLSPLIFNDKKYSHPISHIETLFICGIFNSFVVDFILRHRISTNLNIFHMKDMPIPLFDDNDIFHNKIIENTAKLICTTDEFSILCESVDIGDYVVEFDKRIILESQINAYVAKIYGLNKKELTLILKKFPIVEQELKDKTMDEFNQLN